MAVVMSPSPLLASVVAVCDMWHFWSMRQEDPSAGPAGKCFLSLQVGRALGLSPASFLLSRPQVPRVVWRIRHTGTAELQQHVSQLTANFSL